MIASILMMLAGSPVAFAVQRQSWDAATSSAYLDVTTGDVDGDGHADKAVLKLACKGGDVTDAYLQPRDSASGMPTGKRQHGEVKIVKEWGPSSPQFRAASPTYDIKKMEGGKTMMIDDWMAIRLNGMPPGVCARVSKTSSNIQNN